MADNDVRSAVPPNGESRHRAAARSWIVVRRADKLSATAAAMADLTTQQLAAETSTRVKHLVHHLTVVDRQPQRHEKQAVRRGL